MVLGANYPKKILPCAKQLARPFEQKAITASLRERYSSHFLLSGFLTLPLADENPVKLDWEDKIIAVNQGSQKGLEIGDINPGIPNFFELKNISSAEIKLTSFTSYPLLDHNFIFEASPEFKNHLAVRYGKAFGFSSEKYSDDDTDYNEKVFQAFKASYENIKKEERLEEILHNNETQLFSHLENKKGKFDFLFAFNLNWYANRVKLIEKIQQALKPDGKAYVLLKTRLKKRRGTEFSYLFQDKVARNFLGIPFRQSLADYLAYEFPEYFQVWRNYYADILIIKGSQLPLDFPITDHVTPLEINTEFPFPVYLWRFL
jgi:SAM-dependent methyltransferase